MFNKIKAYFNPAKDRDQRINVLEEELKALRKGKFATTKEHVGYIRLISHLNRIHTEYLVRGTFKPTPGCSKLDNDIVKLYSEHVLNGSIHTTTTPNNRLGTDEHLSRTAQGEHHEHR